MVQKVKKQITAGTHYFIVLKITADVVFPRRKAYIRTEELKHPPKKRDVEGVFGCFFST